MKTQSQGPLMFLPGAGWLHHAEHAVLAFGDAKTDLQGFRNDHPGIVFTFLKQVHSDKRVLIEQKNLVSSATFEGAAWPEADAQWTRTKGVALCIRTADCLPVLILTRTAIAAIHAGWRGLEAGIIQKTLGDMKKAGVDLSNAKAVIGPHIGKANYEVGSDVAAKLTAVFRKLRYNPAPISYGHPTDQDKRMVELSTLAWAQLIDGGIDERAIGEVKSDTFADSDYHSYRRNGEKAGRQISFIYMK